MPSNFTLLVLLLVATRALAAPPPLSQCHEYSTSLISNSADTHRILIQDFANSTSGFTKAVPDHTLPPECGADFSKCNSVIIHEHFLVTPAAGNLVVSNVISVTSQPDIIPISDPSCNPTNLFFDEERNLLWVTCWSRSNDLFVLMHLPFTVSVTDGGIRLTRDYISSSQTSISGASFSETLLVSDRCISSKRLYTVVDGVIWHFPISFGANPHFDHVDTQLENCEKVAYLEHSETDAVFTIHCSNGVSVRYSACSDSVQHFSLSEDGIPFSCNLFFTPDTIRVTDGSVVTHINHTFGIVRHGTCRGGFFIVIAADGSLNAVHLSTGTVTVVARSVCVEDGVCIVPSFSPFDPGFLVYDTAESSLKSVNILQDCTSPVIQSYADSSVQRPSLTRVTGQAETNDCECQDVQARTDIADPTMETPSPTDGANVTMGTESILILRENPNLVSILVPIAAGIVIIITLGTFISIFLALNTKRKRAERNQNLCESLSGSYDGLPQTDLKKIGDESNANVLKDPASPQEMNYLSTPSSVREPAAAAGSGHGSALVNSSDPVVPHSRLTAESVAENAQLWDAEDRANGTRHAVTLMRPRQDQ